MLFIMLKADRAVIREKIFLAFVVWLVESHNNQATIAGL